MVAKLRPIQQQLLVLLASCSSIALAVAFAFANAGRCAADDEQEYRRPPWHLVDTWWDVGQQTAFESYSIDVTISDAVPEGVNLYIAPVGLGRLSGTNFYGGIQTNADGHTKNEQRLRRIGPGLLFSMWGERSLDAIRPSVGGLCQSSGHEGDFISVRRKYDWTPGKYTYRLTRMDRQIVDDKPHTWVGAFLYSHERDENVFVGALRFPGEALVLDKKIASFVEIYGPRIPLSQIPKLTVTFGDLRINGEPVQEPKAVAVYTPDVPEFAEASAKDGRLVIRIGDRRKNAGQRSVPLLPAATTEAAEFTGK